MNSSLESSSTNHDVEKKAIGHTPEAAERSIANGNISLLCNPAYERYLELHDQFQGPARTKLIRKRESSPGPVSRIRSVGRPPAHTIHYPAKTCPVPQTHSHSAR